MVSAAAGSGKTAVMTEHVFRLVEEGVEIASMGG
ncbi:MAG: UvrD-helicase domain-containing protein, partial [Christensenellaceae bacterium]